MNNESIYEITFNPIEWRRYISVSDECIAELLIEQFRYFSFCKNSVSGHKACVKIFLDAELYTVWDYETDVAYEKLTRDEMLSIFGVLVFKLKDNYENEKFWILHAGACVSDNNKLVVLVGPTHAGKSTLTTQLVASGRFTYLTDDSLAYDKATGKFIGFPRPITLRSTKLLDERISYVHFDKNGTEFFGLKNHFMSSGVMEYNEIVIFCICREKIEGAEGMVFRTIPKSNLMMYFILNAMNGKKISENHMIARRLCGEGLVSAYSVSGYEGDEAYKIICREVLE